MAKRGFCPKMSFTLILKKAMWILRLFYKSASFYQNQKVSFINFLFSKSVGRKSRQCMDYFFFPFVLFVYLRKAGAVSDKYDGGVLTVQSIIHTHPFNGQKTSSYKKSGQAKMLLAGRTK